MLGMEMPTRKKHCTCLEFVDSTSNDWLFGKDVLVTDKSIPLLLVHNLALLMFL